LQADRAAALGVERPGQSASTATTTTTASTAGSGGGGGATTTTGQGGCCDCDGDGVAAEGLCGGTDRDGGNKEVHPGALPYHDVPSANGFDCDCNATPDPNPPLDIAVDCGLVGLPCAQKTGFLGKVVPPCGAPGDWGTCQGTIIPCTPQVVETAKKTTCR